MGLDGGFADEEFSCDLSVAHPLGDAPKDLHLSFGEQLGASRALQGFMYLSTSRLMAGVRAPAQASPATRTGKSLHL